MGAPNTPNFQQLTNIENELLYKTSKEITLIVKLLLTKEKYECVHLIMNYFDYLIIFALSSVFFTVYCLHETICCA